MKSKKLLFLVSLLAMTSLVACDGLNNQIPIGKDSGSTSSDASGDDETDLPSTSEEAIEKIYDLGRTRGFEVAVVTQADNGQTDTITIGFKNKVLWSKGNGAFKEEGPNVDVYNYNSEKGYYVYSGGGYPIDDQYSLRNLLKNLATTLSIGYRYIDDSQEGFISDVKDTTFLGRSAKEYTFSYHNVEAQADLKIVFDYETGITLKLSGGAIVVGEGSTISSYEVTSFKVGDDVTLPRLVKEGGQGGQGDEDDDEEEDVDVFKNKLLIYVSNENYSEFNGSKIALFNTLWFELSFIQNGYLVVYLGSYFASSNTSAAIQITKIYKEETKQLIDIHRSWTLDYANGVYSLKVTQNGTVNYAASAEAPTHSDIPTDILFPPDPEDDKYRVTKQQWEDMIIGAELVGLESNFTATVRTSDNQRGYTSYQFDEGKIYVTSVDSDGSGSEYYAEYTESDGNYQYVKDPETGTWSKQAYTFGIGGYMNSLGVLAIDYDDLSFNTTTKQYDVSSYQGTFETFTNIHFYFEDGKLLEMTYQGQYASREVKFYKYGTTKVTLPDIGGGSQQESKWPAEDIAAKLTQIGVNVTLPTPNTDDDNIASITAFVPEDNSELRITITLVQSSNVSTLLNQYISGIQGFATDYYSSDTENGVYGLLNETKDTIIKLLFDPALESPVLTIVVSKFNGNPYPTNQIVEYFRTKGLTTILPSLSMNNVSYAFVDQTDMAYLLMQPIKGNTAETIVSSVTSILCNNGFKTVSVPAESEEGGLITIFIDPAIEYYVSLDVLQDGNVYVFISVGGEEMASIDFEYPQEKINAFIPEEITDAIPTLAVDGAAYMIGQDGNGFQLLISLQPNGTSAERAFSNLQTAIASSNYTLDQEDKGYRSANDQIVIYISNVLDKIIQVQVRFAGEEPPVDPKEISYTLVCTNDWDITQLGAQLYAYVWDDKGNYDWIELIPNGESTFILETYDNWTGVKVVRFSSDSEIGWREGPDGSVNEKVIILNETNDLQLDGQGGYIDFFLLG